jgi:hypothetical protein
MKRYLLYWLPLTGALLIAVAAFNFVIDPYGLFGVTDRAGFNSIKPTVGAHGSMAKAYQVLRLQPHGLILGNSRMEVGFDPESPSWPAQARPVFNLALPGTGTSTTVHYLQHVLANTDGNPAAKPNVVVWGIDFMDFLVDSNISRDTQKRAPIHKASENARLLTNPDGSRNASRAFQQAKDYAVSTFTLEAFLDSVQTLANQRNPYSENLTPLGFNPMRDYLKIEADEGYWAVFRQRDLENIKAYLRRPMGIFDADGRSSPALDDLRQVMNLCRRYGIALHLVIYPYHAHLLEIIRITGHWPAFEAWQRAIVDIVGSQSRTPATTTVSLWDFSSFNEVSMEPIPDKGDRHTKMRWYWEAGHFKSELGNRIQARIFGRTGSIPGFGVLLGPATVEAQIATVRAQESDYRRSHWQEVEWLEQMAAKIKAQQLNS